MSILGIHYSDSFFSSFDDIVLFSEQHNIRFVQMFLHNPLKYFINQPFLSKNNLKSLVVNLAKLNIVPIAHAGYLTSFSSPKNIGKASVYDAIGLCNLCKYLCISTIVFHCGHNNSKHNLPMDDAFDIMATNIKTILNKTSDVLILLETGKGSKDDRDMGSLHHLTSFFERYGNSFPVSRLGLCLDTQHIFADGYNDYTSLLLDKSNRFYNLFVNRLRLVHLNANEKTKLGGHIDKHSKTRFGDSEDLSLEILSPLLTFCYSNSIPMIIERGYRDCLEDDLNLVRKFVYDNIPSVKDNLQLLTRNNIQFRANVDSRNVSRSLQLF